VTDPRTLKELSPPELEALGSLASRAAARAAQSLGLLLGLRDGDLHAQPFRVGGAQDVEEALGPKQAVAVMFRLAGGVNGRFWLVAPLPDMLVLAARLLGNPSRPPTALDENTRGALAEAGNVVSSSFINVFGDTLRQVCYPSVPDVRLAPTSLLSRLALDATDVVGLMRVRGDTNPPVHATFLWSPDPLSLSALVRAIRQRQSA
jgi:chemotaxis protein CheY-P-specific phosphatase CheC